VAATCAEAYDKCRLNTRTFAGVVRQYLERPAPAPLVKGGSSV
jgi:hypothetical protein